MPEISLPTKSVQDIIKQTTDQILAAVNAKNTSKILRKKVFTTNGVFNVPSGVTEVLITGGGAGGGGSAVLSAASKLNGAAGTDTEFGNLLTLKGGKGTTLVGGDVIMPGGAGGPGGESGTQVEVNSFANGKGGNSGFFFGGLGADGNVAAPEIRNGNYCSGGAAYTVLQRSGGGGGGGEFVRRLPVAVTPLTEIPVKLGVGGAGGNYLAGKGGNGWLAVEWWE